MTLSAQEGCGLHPSIPTLTVLSHSTFSVLPFRHGARPRHGIRWNCRPLWSCGLAEGTGSLARAFPPEAKEGEFAEKRCYFVRLRVMHPSHRTTWRLPMWNKYGKGGTLEDLEESIQCHLDLRLVQPLVLQVASLEHSNDINDLNASIAYLHQALSNRTLSHPHGLKIAGQS